MKNFILSLIVAIATVFSASAQYVDNGGIKDNWYVSGSVGTQVWNTTNSWTLDNVDVNVVLGKYFNPYIGAEIDAQTVFGTTGTSNFVDRTNVTLNGVVNLSNLFAGYDGVRHSWDVEAIGGLGWSQTYIPGRNIHDKLLHLGLRNNWNFKNFSPFVMVEYNSIPTVNTHIFTLNPSGVNVAAGIKYTIPSKRGNFPEALLYDVEEVTSLNNTIDSLNKELAKKPEVERVIVNSVVTYYNDNTYSILFDKGSSQVGDVQKIADIIKGKNCEVTIIGTTSPEGSESVNKKLGIARAEAVKEALVNAGVSEKLITISSDYSDLRQAIIKLK